ncbi:MAG: signal recognition particle-docking protein FtsY, partial [candidate division NC10 bacterium]|nr:signal recognition particle-docking protein FtsY [candidate division NC10 bacterium]
RTQEALMGRMDLLLSGRAIDDSSWEELEEILLSADLGVPTVESLLASLKERAKRRPFQDSQDLKASLKGQLLSILEQARGEAASDQQAIPWVILVLGVNGTGKTTTIAKLTHRYLREGKSVLLAAADTYRAAAAEQLKIWADGLGVEMIHHQPGGDPSAVAFDAVHAARSRKKEILIIDTAGRLHSNRGLMEELKKMKRTIGRQMEGAPHEVLLVLDATTGNNGLQQARDFQDGVGLTGLVIAKLDGTAKGGIVVAIADQLKIPVKYIGLGEQLEDLQDFNPQAFVEALFQTG